MLILIMKKEMFKIRKFVIIFLASFLFLSSAIVSNVPTQNVSAATKDAKVLNSSNKVIDDYFNKVLQEEKNNGKLRTSGVFQWVKDASKFAKDALKAGVDFLVLDDIKTIFNPNASKTDKALAAVMLFPAGKVLKTGKVVDLLTASGKKEVVSAYAGLGKILKHNSRGVLFEGSGKKGWKHIKNGHIKGIGAKKGDTFYPKHLKESEIKNIIMTSLKKGKYKGKSKNGNKSYQYKINKYGIKNMKVIVDKNNIIVTAYPMDGKSVKKKK